MRNFILGIITTLLALALGGVGFILLGMMPTNADAVPPEMERRIATTALDASMDHHAPHVNNPVLPTDDNLIEGMKIYTMNCALCHGTLDYKPSALEKSFYPPPPQIILDPLDDPEWHIYYAVRTGVRYTGMPAWGGTLSEQDMWKISSFLTHMGKLSPAVGDYWNRTYGVYPRPPRPGKEKEDHD